MKKLLLLIALFLPIYAQAVNYLGFGGGNYVYAENGNLYFNLDPYVFDNRSWTYDETKGFSSEIKVNMDLKTKYTSDEWLEQVLANKKSDGIMYANYIKQPFSYKNKGQFQQTWFWLARMAPSVGGFIGRSVAWNKFKSWAAGAAVSYGVFKYFCDQLLNDGITCNATGGFTKTYEYAYVASTSFNTSDILVKDIRLTEEEFANDAAMVQKAYNNVSRTSHVYGSTYGTLTNCSRGTGAYSNYVSCGYADPNNKIYSRSINFQKEAKTLEEMVNDPELLPYFDKTCKLFPSECVNEPTQGKNIKDVQLTGGVVGSPVSVIGPPYTNPITGTAQQDQVIIGGGSSGIGVNSGTNDSWTYNPTLGQSGTLNPTQVTSIARPDLTNTDTAPVAKPNEQTGTKPQVVNPSVPDINIEFPEFTDIAEFCKENPRANACIEFEEVEKQKDVDLPEIQEKFDFNKLNIFATDGLCPQGSQFSIGVLGINKTFEFSYQPACDFAVKLRYVLIAIAMLIALKIVFGFGGVKK